MDLAERVSALRAFNRMWTARIGVLDEHLHETPYSLTEARVIFELAQRPATEVLALRTTLDLDPGYTSRILAKLEREGLVRLEPSATDKRRQIAALTKAGRGAFQTLNSRSTRDITALLEPLDDDEQQRMVGAMREIERVFARRERGIVVVRSPRAGDMGWIVERHGALYAREYAWTFEFEALVAQIVGAFDPAHDAAWIAEVDNERAGCVMCVRKSATVAQLRLLLVEPTARGLGIGAKLVAECIAFARAHHYKKLVLWTNDVLVSARRIYEGAGFTLTKSGKHHSFGHDLVEQTWELTL
ncbi:MAG: helix-turn-helix domain-containing GNAT family N-acetyltransferase [Kofleriaceae bacterium]